MRTQNLNMRIDPQTKAKAELIYSKFGITLSDAVNMFLNKSIMTGGLPFDLVIQPEYNAETIAAMEEGKQLAKDMIAGKVKGYNNINDMIEALNANT